MAIADTAGIVSHAGRAGLAAAVGLSPIDGFVTYDERQAAAARLAGLRTLAPGGPGEAS
jgi:hypothetical protein